MIPREKLFGNPQRSTPRISPDGRHLAFRAPKDGVMNVWVAEVGDIANARAVTEDRSTGISQYFWAFTNRHILFLQDDDGDENYHLYSVNIETMETLDLTPVADIRALVVGVEAEFPTRVLVGINDRDQHFLHDVYQVDITSGEREMEVLNPGFAGFVADGQYSVRLGIGFTPDAEMQVFKHAPETEGKWEPLATIGSEDVLTTSPIGFDKSGENLFMIDSRGRDKAGLVRWNLESGETELLFSDPRADVSGVLAHPTEKHIQAVSSTYLRTEWHVLDDSIAADLEYLQSVTDGELDVSSRSQDDNLWTVSYLKDDGPVEFYLYNRREKKAEFLFSHRPELSELPLVKMHPEVIPSRDGLEMVSYLSLPKSSDPDGDGRPDRALPMVLLVHGGPWARDDWGFDPLHQLFANRGYAVLAVNYRGSTGFGKGFINAANREWAGKMHDDLLDAVEWAVGEGIAERDKVAIAGGSYGGYATLVGLTFTPDTFACGVDIVGPSSIVTLLQDPPPYWQPLMPMMKQRVGDWETEAGREFLDSRSPLFKCKEITKPLLIGQGANDPRVKQSESDQIVAAMNEGNIPVTYMLFPEEGHGFARPENNQAFFAVTEAFLARHLGGRYEAIGDSFSGAKFTVPAGVGGVPGLQEAVAEEDDQ